MAQNRFINQTIALIPPLLFALVIFVQEMVGPRAGDSVEYAYVYAPSDSQPTYRRISSLSDLIESQTNFYHYENGRVAIHSLVQPLCALRSSIPFAILDAMMYLLLVWLMLRILRFKPTAAAILLTSCGAYVFIAPCSSDIAFQVNYLWTATLICGFIWVFIRIKSCRRWVWPLLVLLGFVAGESNEAFTGGILIACAGWLVLRPGRNSPQQYVLTICFAAGFMVNVLAPGNLVKLSKFLTDSPMARLLHLALNNWYGILLIPILIIRKHHGLDFRHYWWRQKFEIMASCTQAAMMFAVGTVYLYACMGIRLMLMLMLLRALSGIRTQRIWQCIAMVLCLAYAGVQLKASIAQARKFSYIREAYLLSADGKVSLPTAFFDDDYRHTPLYAKPMTFERREADTNAPAIMLLPQGLETLPADKDTNFIFTPDSITWITVQSKTSPQNYYLVKHFNIPGREFTDVRPIDASPQRRLDFWIETDSWRMGVYHNTYPWLFNTEVTSTPPVTNH